MKYLFGFPNESFARWGTDSGGDFRQRESGGNQPNKSGKPGERNEKRCRRKNQAQATQLADGRKNYAEDNNPLGQKLHKSSGDRYSRHQKTQRRRETNTASRKREVIQCP